MIDIEDLTLRANDSRYHTVIVSSKQLKELLRLVRDYEILIARIESSPISRLEGRSVRLVLEPE